MKMKIITALEFARQHANEEQQEMFFHRTSVMMAAMLILICLLLLQALSLFCIKNTENINFFYFYHF